MKCSMMFKRSFSCCLILCLLLVLLPIAHADGVMPEENGNLLVVHRRNPDQADLIGIEKLVNLGAAMRQVVDYGTQEECLDVLNRYKYIICYNLVGTTPGFVSALKTSGAEIMIIGSTFMEQYLKNTGSKISVGTTQQQKSGRLIYTFPTGQKYEGIVSWSDMYSFSSDDYQNGTIEVGTERFPFCRVLDGVRFLPIVDLSQTLVAAATAQEVTLWMWPYNDRPTSYAQFLVLDSVYPFMPPEVLYHLIDRIEECSVPYVISVMPLANNTNYPAMKQFCQVLAYAQSKGASIVLHAPILHKVVEDSEELFEKLTDMTTPYIQNGVFPVGIEVPRSWTNEEPYLTVLSRYRTVFVYDDGKESRFDLDAHTSLIARQGHQLVSPLMALDQAGISQLECYASATYADCGTEAETLLRYAQTSRSSENPFSDLRDYNHAVWLNNAGFTMQDRNVYLNGKLVDTTFHPTEYDTEFDFHRSPLVRMSIDLQNQNRVLMVIVLILMIIFCSFIVYARHRMRKRFFSASHSTEE